jgi:hypothetical protein
MSGALSNGKKVSGDQLNSKSRVAKQSPDSLPSPDWVLPRLKNTFHVDGLRLIHQRHD